jgi:hypothetical protein
LTGKLAVVTPFVTAGAGFLFAVLWFDLMHDVQVLRHGGRDLPESVLASIAGYYRRVTTDSRPMNRLVAAVMLSTLAAIGVQIAGDDVPRWMAWTSLGLAAWAIIVAAVRTVPNAMRLGRRTDDSTEQSRLARSIWRDHLCCLAAIGLLLAIELSFGR